MAEEVKDETQGLMAEHKSEETESDTQEMVHKEPAVEPDEVEFTRPEYLPEEYWDADSGPKIEALMGEFNKTKKSYSELRTKMSRGEHKPPEVYETKDLGDFQADDPLLSVYKDWAKENMISQEAFNKLGQKFVEIQNSQVNDAQINIETEKAALGKNADEIIKSNVQWGRGLVSKGVFTEDDYSELEVLGGTAAGQRLLQKVRGLMGEKEIPVAAVSGQAYDRSELFALVQDPRYQTDVKYRKSVERTFQDTVK